MKLKCFLLLAIMLLTSASANAQSKIDRQIRNIVENGYARQTKAMQEMDSMGITTGRCEIYRLEIPQSQSRMLDDILEALDNEQKNAYYQLMENADSPNRRTTALTYGNEGESVIIGSDPEMNYRVICFVDPDRDNYRTGYAIEWADNDGQIDGRIVTTYGTRPSAKKSLGRIDDLGEFDLSKLGEILPEAIKTIKVIGKDDLKKLGDLEGLKDLGDYLGILTGEMEVDDEEATDDVQWLTQFNHYRNAFLRAVERNSSTAASYATNILKLCKKANKANLSANEKKLCIKNIKEMRKKTKDTFLQGLLDEASDLLK